MPFRAIMLAGSLAATQVSVPVPEIPTTYRVEEVPSDISSELIRYPIGNNVLEGEDTKGRPVVFVFGITVESVFEPDPGDGQEFTSASKCVTNTGTVWLRVELNNGGTVRQGFINSGDVCIGQDDDRPFYQSRFPLSNKATKFFLDKGVGGDDLVAADHDGNLIALMLNPSIAWSEWLRLACVSVASSQVKCYKDPPTNHRLCHSVTRYIYNWAYSCPSGKKWVKQSGTYQCSCP